MPPRAPPSATASFARVRQPVASPRTTLKPSTAAPPDSSPPPPPPLACAAWGPIERWLSQKVLASMAALTSSRSDAIAQPPHSSKWTQSISPTLSAEPEACSCILSCAARTRGDRRYGATAISIAARTNSVPSVPWRLRMAPNRRRLPPGAVRGGVGWDAGVSEERSACEAARRRCTTQRGEKKGKKREGTGKKRKKGKEKTEKDGAPRRAGTARRKEERLPGHRKDGGHLQQGAQRLGRVRQEASLLHRQPVPPDGAARDVAAVAAVLRVL